MRPQGCTKTLPVALTPEELAEKSQLLAKAVDAVAAQETTIAEQKGLWSEKKKAMEGYLGHLKTEANTLAGVVESGREEREIQCSWLYSLANAAVFLVRDDTGELVRARKLQDDERQADLTEVLREPTPDQLAEWLPQVKEEF